MTTMTTINSSLNKISLFSGSQNNKFKKTVDIPLINEESNLTFEYDDEVDDDMENFDMIDTSTVNIINENDTLNGNDSDDSNNNNSSNKPQTKELNELSQQSAVPQRKKPGRKPNPASPALRKAQNRAAQRAFRERKERHLRDLENTIQSLRACQAETVNKFNREREQLRSLISHFETENNYLKQVVLNFECALNNHETSTKIKSSVLRNFTSPNPLGSTQVPSSSPNPPTQRQQQQLLQVSPINSINLNLSPPTSSSITPSPEIGNLSSPISSPPSTPGSDSLSINGPYLIDINSRDTKFTTSSSPPNNVSNIPNNQNLIYQNGSNENQSLMKTLNANPSLFSQFNNNSNNNISYLPDPSNLINLEFDTTYFFNSADFQSINDSKNANFEILQIPATRPQSIVGNMGPRSLTREDQQLIRLAKAMGCPDHTVPLKPKVKRKLTPQQEYFLSLPHDTRIDFIPCYHFRSRMIQYQAFYDLYEIIELLLSKAKCHGNPADPDSWECPPEFFERYPFLVFQHCRLKCHFYQKFGELPPNFEEISSTLEDE